MGTLRFVAAMLAVLIAAFFGVHWLLAIHPLKPDARLPTFQHVDEKSARYQMETNSFSSDNDAVRDALRQAVFRAADDLSRQPCIKSYKERYVGAVTQYVRARLSIAPCIGTKTCGESDGPRLELAEKAFGSPFDRRVWDAMRKAHQASVFVESDFPKEIIGLVSTMAADPMNNPRAVASLRKVDQEMRSPSECSAAL